MSRTIVILTTLLLLSATVQAEPKTELLWPAAPGKVGDAENDKPKLIVHLPEAEKATGCGIVVCPGGGYGGLAMDHEGKQIAAWLNSLGVAAFICDYRHRGKGYGHPAPLQDAQRAIRTVRAGRRSSAFSPTASAFSASRRAGISPPPRVTHFDKGNADSADPIEKVSCRPDFGVLCYAVIAFEQPYTHKGSQHNLIGKDAPKELVESLSNEKQVTSETPPTFFGTRRKIARCRRKTALSFTRPW